MPIHGKVTQTLNDEEKYPIEQVSVSVFYFISPTESTFSFQSSAFFFLIFYLCVCVSLSLFSLSLSVSLFSLSSLCLSVCLSVSLQIIIDDSFGPLGPGGTRALMTALMGSGPGMKGGPFKLLKSIRIWRSNVGDDGAASIVSGEYAVLCYIVLL
jgi:hypothetical protein